MELWLDEALELKNGRALKIKVKEFLHSRTTPFQKMTYSNLLVSEECSL